MTNVNIPNDPDMIDESVLDLALKQELKYLKSQYKESKQIHPDVVTELKNLKSPPETVIIVMKAALTLLGDTWVDWKTCLAVQMKNLLYKIKMLDIEYVSRDRYKVVKKMVTGDQFNVESIRHKSLSTSILAQWVLAGVNYLDFIYGLSVSPKKKTKVDFNQRLGNNDLNSLSSINPVRARSPDVAAIKFRASSKMM